ncbi:variable surface protein Vir6-like [Plasmodium vivax]|uniref:Variable surface protein Vir6-like n=1 Tax=Plasmodium vivax (strain Salvador I) TaxID=126793 RepID=A5KDA4_PLAVS|nr:variable surface protein Vir6-like [Plasmodium vivax]EDL42665.1 variable surface protein Vir6-like [Plasmodium vivax]|eukprot:XP_001612458.1 variable surface protein Vir6-like [Plasmodium vivax Sal-1]
MASNKWNEQYLNHDDYSFFKTNFKINRKLTENEGKNLKTIIELLGDASYNTEIFNNILELLMKYLNSGHVMYNCRSDKCCRYINYSIAKKFREINYVQYIESKFNIFKKFMEGYYKTTRFWDCKDRLDYINPLILSRMDILYDLYDKYNYLISLKSNDANNKLCITLSLIAREYREAIKLHEGDENFIKELENFRKFILSKNPNYNRACGWNLTSITLPNPVTPHQDEMQEQKLNSHVPTQQPSLNELEKSRTVVGATDESELSRLPGLQSESLQLTEVKPKSLQPTEVQALPVNPLSAHPQSSHPQSSHSESSHSESSHPQSSHSESTQSESTQSESTHLESTHSNPVQLKREQAEAEEFHDIQLPSNHHSQNEWQTREFMESIDQKTHNSEYPIKDAEHTDGLFGKMREIFAGTLGEVDPVPVVGVSGGMGALFLLFRYTPFGTFFRGGRGRAHRIPRSFNGQFPGFPDYYEYDRGYIGYAPMNINPLAE